MMTDTNREWMPLMVLWAAAKIAAKQNHHAQATAAGFVNKVVDLAVKGAELACAPPPAAEVTANGVNSTVTANGANSPPFRPCENCGAEHEAHVPCLRF